MTFISPTVGSLAYGVLYVSVTTDKAAYSWQASISTRPRDDALTHGQKWECLQYVRCTDIELK